MRLSCYKNTPEIQKTKEKEKIKIKEKKRKKEMNK
jgi:hypothetical protein